jgi:hypothetical protein
MEKKYQIVIDFIKQEITNNMPEAQAYSMFG